MAAKSRLPVLPPFEAVILDLDGLVLDTEPTYRLAWRRAAEDLGCPLSEAFCRSLAGRQYDDVERAIMSTCGEGFSAVRFREAASRHWRGYVRRHGIGVKPGLSSLLTALSDRGKGFCVATNSRLDKALECLQRAGVDSLFPDIVARDQVARGKPEPDLFESAARRLGTAADRCLAVEDSDIGIEAAFRAGTIPVMIPDAVEPSELSRQRALLTLQSMEELAGVVRAGVGNGRANRV